MDGLQSECSRCAGDELGRDGFDGESVDGRGMMKEGHMLQDAEVEVSRCDNGGSKKSVKTIPANKAGIYSGSSRLPNR